MQSFQQRTIDRIEAAAAKHGIECSMSQDWSNTGRINLHEKGQSRAFGFVRFDFQTSRYTLSLTVNGKSIPSQHGRADYFDFYQDNDAPTRFWDAFNTSLAQVMV